MRNPAMLTGAPGNNEMERAMLNVTTKLCMFSALAGIGFAVAILAPSSAAAQNQHMEVIHHPNYDKSVFMPFVPAIKIKSGKVLWLAGTTALPVYHDHPHKRDQIQKYMVNDLEAQTRAAMDGIKQTLDAAGASFKDVVHYFVFRARPRMGDIGKASAVINSYFAPFNHKPTSTNIAVLELGEPEQLIEIQMFAVVD
jgi:enamine deaminase RidA (YjgF/YER057c/UK114 family)